MTNTVSYLKINRLIITKDIDILYDEHFHEGVNIIRGDHSVGKSTILDMIFYVLGGELKKEDWREPADRCSYVIAEITINNKTITLKRPVDPTGVPKISIFDGSYENAKKNTNKWGDYGSRRSNEKSSFSEVMFELFNWGQFKSNDYQNLTMHQIMRLIYLSQSSDSRKIFRKEHSRSDNDSTRLAIAEFLFGLDNMETHSFRQNLLKFERLYEIRGAELETYIRLLGNDAGLTVDKIESQLDEKNTELQLIENKKISILNNVSGPTSDDDYDLAIERSDAFKKGQELVKKIQIKKAEYQKIKIEIQDCILFNDSLSYRMKALKESQDLYDNLGLISFEYCPCCLTPVNNDDQGGGVCMLCKSNNENHSLESRYIETLNELQYQLRQNNKIIEKFLSESDYLKCFISELENELTLTQNRLFEISLVSNERELAIASLIDERTRKLIEINSLKEKKNFAAKMDDLKTNRSDILLSIENCKTRITELEAKNIERRKHVDLELSKIATSILEKDLGNEDKFNIATKLTSKIDFIKDKWLLDGRVNYSDSSNVIKKATLHLAFLLFSINDKHCRYPRFSIMDFECGDVNEERNRNLQKTIISSLDGKVGYQLIMATSKIASEFNNDKYGVGRYYEKNDYILKP